MKYLGQMKKKNNPKKLSWGLFEHFYSRFKASLSTSKRRLWSTERGWKHILIRLANFQIEVKHVTMLLAYKYKLQTARTGWWVRTRFGLFLLNIMHEKSQTSILQSGSTVVICTSSHVQYCHNSDVALSKNALLMSLWVLSLAAHIICITCASHVAPIFCPAQ